MIGDPTFPGEVMDMASVVQSPIAWLSSSPVPGFDAVCNTGAANVFVVKSYRIRQISVLQGHTV